MQYRNFGNTGLKVSLLGMGCMRLPFKDENDRTLGVVREKAYELIQYAVDNGVNYFDTALTYHACESEAILGEALEEKSRRAKVNIATKQLFGAMTTQEEIRRNLENTLKKLRTDYIDVYLLHCITSASWDQIQQRKIFEEFEKFKAEGLIKHIGFSFHGGFSTFKDVVERYPWEMCLIQQNLLDVNREVTEEAIFTAHKNNMAVAVMEPLRGGGLAQAPKPVADVYNNFHTKRPPAEWAFRHLANYPEVSTIVSGMSTMEQLKDNIALFSQSDMVPECLSVEEKKLIASAREAYESIVSIPCTSCDYCVPCPLNVDIPGIFKQYNDGNRFENFDNPRRSYMYTRRGNRSALACTNCGECLPKCPQEINIPEKLQTAHKALDGWDE
ncbi:MAG: aldo/keto reductase [Defluviitaleaceae bacterium]|nr:aldo/keto reductase [Defluviitaleaceae bacterium]